MSALDKIIALDSFENVLPKIEAGRPIRVGLPTVTDAGDGKSDVYEELTRTLVPKSGTAKLKASIEADIAANTAASAAWVAPAKPDYTAENTSLNDLKNAL